MNSTKITDFVLDPEKDFILTMFYSDLDDEGELELDIFNNNNRYIDEILSLTINVKNIDVNMLFEYLRNNYFNRICFVGSLYLTILENDNLLFISENLFSKKIKLLNFEIECNNCYFNENFFDNIEEIETVIVKYNNYIPLCNLNNTEKIVLIDSNIPLNNIKHKNIRCADRAVYLITVEDIDIEVMKRNFPLPPMSKQKSARN